MPDIKLQSEYDDLDKYIDSYGHIWYSKKNTQVWHNPYGPAHTTKNGYKAYLIENKLHRLDGPAITYSNGEEEYWINNEYLTKENFEKHPDVLKFLGREHLICLT